MSERPILFSKPMVRALLYGSKTQTRRISKPHAKPGDVLYVREAFRFGKAYDDRKPSDVPQILAGSGTTVFYEADGTPAADLGAGKLRPGIHMPRWCSRIERTVVDVRSEKLKDCSDADALAEGVEFETADPPFYYVPGIWPHSLTAVETYEGPVASYAKLWDYINGAGSWASNPTVWIIEFSAS